MNNKKLTIGLVVVAIIAIIALFTPTAAKSFRTGAVSVATTNLPSMGLAKVQVGSGCDQAYTSCTGSPVSQHNFGFCYIQPYATTIAASSTANVDCQGTAAIGSPTNMAVDTPLTGVNNGDVIVASLSTTTAGTTFLGLSLLSVSASTTNGYITARLSNGTGGTFTWPTTGTASGTLTYFTER